MATTSFDREVERNFTWNFGVNLLDISFIMLGLSLVSRETVIPLLLSKLTPSTIVIGLLPAVYSLGMFLPQLFGAGVTEALPYKKPFVATVGALGERLPYLLAGVAVLLLAEPAPAAAVFALVFLLGLSGASAGFATPAWFDMIAKVIPVRRRGLFTGLGHGLGALMGVAGAGVIALVLERQPYPRNFALLFVLAFAAMAISWVGLALNREPANPSLRPATPLRSYLRQLPGVLRADGNFSRYIAASTIIQLGSMPGSFLLVYGASRFELGGADVGLLTGVLIGCQALLNPVCGLLADRYGHKLVLVAGALALGLSALAAWIGPSRLWLVAAFVLYGAFLAANTASFLTIIPEFCADDARPTYIGLANTLMAPVSALAPLLGGWLATQLGYAPMFGIAAVLSIAGAALLAGLVREPRHRAPQAVQRSEHHRKDAKDAKN